MPGEIFYLLKNYIDLIMDPFVLQKDLICKRMSLLLRKGEFGVQNVDAITVFHLNIPNELN